MASRESEPDWQSVDVAGPALVGDAVAAARRYASGQGLAPRDVARLCIIVEEVLANMVEHAGYPADAPVRIGFGRKGPDLALTIEDCGKPFDPRTAIASPSIPDRGGGAGLRLIRAWSDVIDYHSDGRRNRLRLSMRLGGT